MPLYEYQCDACGCRFERIQKFSDPPVTDCPNCGQPQVHKLLSSPAIQFKGTGWYITDYARKGTGSDSTKSGESKTTEGGNESKSSETKSGETKSSDAKPVESKPAPGTDSSS
jgi:putative FmdB family regulatory protein